MFFRLHHSVVLECELAKAHDICINPANLAQLQSLSTFDYEVLHRGDNSATPAVLTTYEQFVAMLNEDTLPDLPWSSLEQTPNAFPHATYFRMTEMGAKVAGSQFALVDQNAVLFHSAVRSADIEERKLRVIDEIEPGKCRVTETVWGEGPAYLMWPLMKLGIPQRQHSRHMDMYHTLLSGRDSHDR